MSSQNNSALASLTATYTDSENEDDEIDRDEDSPQTDESVESQVIIPTITRTPVKVQSAQSTPSKVEQSKSALRLVSYNDDTLVSDDEEQSPDEENVAMEEIEEESKEEKKTEEPELEEEKVKKDDRSIEYGFTLPEVKGKCPQDLQEKITKMHERMKANSLDMNKLIQERKEFRNPSIYEKLIQFCDIDELGTNYPPELYDPMQWGKESFYEELARVQKIEMDKREKDPSKNDVLATATKKAEEEAKKRRSKWDQPAPGVSIQPSFTIKSGVLPTLTITATGTKGTVIPAFGAMSKKPKV